MLSPSHLQSIRVSYCLAVDNTPPLNQTPYDFCFQLHPGAQALAFEPFLTLMRKDYQNAESDLTDLLTKTSLSKRLQKLLQAWILKTDADEIEPLNPDDLHDEQGAIRQALFELIHLAFNDNSQRILIEHAEYLPVSASELIQQINSSADGGLIVDLKLRPADLQQWWPDDAIQRELKHRFLISGTVRPLREKAEQTIFIGQSIPDLDTQISWAKRLMCGGELKHLVAHLSLTSDHEYTQIEQLCYSVNSATFNGNLEECAQLLSNLNQQDWHHCPQQIQKLVFETRYFAHTWFHQFAEAEAVSRNYIDWAQEQGETQSIAYAQLLHFNAQCLTGNFSYDETMCSKLEAQLEQLEWRSMYQYLICSYWFDHQYTLTHQQSLIEHCNQALEFANTQQDLVAVTRVLHYLSVIHQRNGHYSEALKSIEQCVEKTLSLKDTHRTYHALNGKAYILILLSRFEEALGAVEQAFRLVVEDNNQEQICTTLCNAALLALFSSHFSGAIKAIDEIFSTMLMRGIPRTRFRTNHELRGIQAIATLFAGDRPFALAIYKVSNPEPANTLEGIVIQKLMMLVQHFNETDNETLFEQLDQLFLETSAMQNLLLALFVLRVQHHLMKTHPERFDHDETLAIQKRAIVFARHMGFKNCTHWFNDETEEAKLLTERFSKLTATKVSKRESQIDLLRIENSLLKLSLDIDAFANRCEKPEELFTYCLNKLCKSITLQYTNLAVFQDSKCQFDISNGNPSNPTKPIHRFSFFYGSKEVRFAIEFDAKTEIFTEQLTQWTSQFVDQLDHVVNHMVARKLSHKMAYKDHLTGLENRAAFENFFATSELQTNDTLSVGFIDLNRFKNINDAHGHQTGDAILSAFAQHLKHSVRTTDLIYRIGGDEFFVVFQNAEASYIQPTLDTKLMSFFHGPRRKDDPNSHLYTQMGCSIGLLQITASQPMKLDRNMIVAKADALMYRAKKRFDSAIEVDCITL